MKKSYTIFLLIFLITPVFNIHAQTFTDPKVCAPGYIQGNVPTTQVPDYTYTPDGFLELHFHLNTIQWKFNYTRLISYDANCNVLDTSPYDYFYAQKKPDYMPWPAVTYLIMRYGKSVGISDAYEPFFYNGDTGEQLPYDYINQVYLWDRTMYNYPVLYPIHRLIFGYKTDSNVYAETGDLFSTPAVPMHITPTKNPVLIIPGVLGTEISKPTDTGPEKLWLDLAHNLTDTGDQFMDPLQFNEDLTPLDTSLTIGDVIRKAAIAFFSFDYSDGLIKEFNNQGYTEGTDLFLFPYDWRYGVNEDNVNKLKQKITDILTQTGASKVDIIAHSTGGLLAKKYVIENPTNNHIRKAIFVGVPNTGAPKAIKALIQGDNFGNSLLADSEMKKLAKNFPVAYDLSPSEQYFNTKGSYIKIIEQPLFANTPKDLNFEESSNFLINDQQLNSQALFNANNLHTANFDNYDMRTAGVDLYAINGCKAGTIGKIVKVTQDPAFNDPASPYYQPNLTPTYQLENTPGDGTVPLESSTNLPINQANKYYALKSEHGKMLSQDGIRQQIVNIISGGSLNVASGLITQDISKCKLNGKAISVFSPLDIDITDQDDNHSGLASDGISIENNIPNADFEIMGEHKFVYLPDDEGQTYIIKVNGTGTGTFTLQNQNISNNKITQTESFTDLPVTPALSGVVNLNGMNTTLSLDENGDGMVEPAIQPSSVVYPDETPPEAVIQFNLLNKDLQFSGTDNFLSPDKIKIQDFGSYVTLTDEANNSLDVAFTQTNRRAALKADLKSLSYNGQLINLGSNLFSFSWKLDGQGLIKSLTQEVKARSNYRVKAVYDGTKTVITGADQTGKINHTYSGLILLKVKTSHGDLSWSFQ